MKKVIAIATLLFGIGISGFATKRYWWDNRNSTLLSGTVTPDALLAEWSASLSLPEDSAMSVAQGQKMLARARLERQCDEYVLAAEIIRGSGDLRAEKDVIDEAVKLFPDQDGPHFLLARLYYALAFDDMMRRGIYDIGLVPVSRFNSSDIRNGPVSVEIHQLLSPARPAAYATALKKVAVDKAMELKILALFAELTKDSVGREAAAYIPELIRSAGGVAEQVPFVTWRPDARTITILNWARKEMDLASHGSRMYEAPGYRLIDRDEFSKLSVAIDRLLHRMTADGRGGYDAGVSAYNSGDYGTAMKEFKAIAEQHPMASNYIGEMYYKGQGVAPDSQVVFARGRGRGQ
jgi:hypothetical protein